MPQVKSHKRKGKSVRSHSRKGKSGKGTYGAGKDYESRKFEKVMTEFKEGTLNQGMTGKKVTDPKMAKAIAISKIRQHLKKKKK